MPQRLTFSHQRFILGEGFEDAAFAKAIITGRHLQDSDISATNDIAGAGGNSAFEQSIIATEPIVGFSRVQSVVLLADNDDNPNASFAAVCRQLNTPITNGDLGRQWRVPAQAGTVAAGDPSVAVWMWPSPGQLGCLETLIWRAIQNLFPNEAICVDTALNCSGANAWPIGKRDKARVRCFLAITHRRDPAVPLGKLWDRYPALIPTTHPAFDQFAQFLGNV